MGQWPRYAGLLLTAPTIMCTKNMELLLGTLAWLAGTAQVVLSFQQLRKANPNEKIPQFFGRPKNHPGEIYAYRAIAIFLLMLSYLAWVDLLGYWAGLLILAGAIPAAILNVQHNREGQAQPTSATG